MEPQDRYGLAQLTRLAFQGHDLQPLRTQLLLQCMQGINVESALLDLSVIEQILGDAEGGLAWQAKALETQRLYRTNHSDASRKTLLVYMQERLMGSNTPVDFLVEGSEFAVIACYPSDVAADDLPPHDIAFCAAPTDCADAQGFQALVHRGSQATGAKVLNLPGEFVNLDRDALPGRFPSAPGLRFAKTLRLKREDVTHQAVAGIGGFPVIIRPVGSHAGRGLAKIGDTQALEQYLATQPESAFFLSEFMDYSSPKDGMFRKYRIVFVDGQPYPVHMAIGPQWDLWYMNAQMDAHPERRAEEADFMDRFSIRFAARHKEALAAVAEGIGLDYFGIDCAEDAMGNLVVFEADNTLIVHDMDPVDQFPYKPRHMQALFAAFQDMLREKAITMGPQKPKVKALEQA
ncbi:MAG: hypothetical protein N4A70_02530 [Pelagimonas sp.]|jgi:hypothetical protein|nr:hypothetical protein [Pelagimonas sp.]